MAVKSVIVIGAGIAWLTAAYYLSKFGAEVTVLEASDRAGGRMSTDRRDGYVLDKGVQFLSGGYSVINELINELGLTKNLTRTSNWTGTIRSGSVRRTNTKYPWTVAGGGLLGWRDAFKLAFESHSLFRQTKQFPMSNYSKWQSLDDEDAAEWVARAFGQNILEYVFEPMLEGLYFQVPKDVE
jgi:oxygen-dependent protoporphyrinogen oxidase